MDMDPPVLGKICRFCLSNDQNSMDLFGLLANEMRIVEIIAQHFWFKPEKNDKFSENICRTCWNLIDNFHQFYDNVKILHDKLNQFSSTQFVSVNSSEVTINVKTENNISSITESDVISANNFIRMNKSKTLKVEEYRNDYENLLEYQNTDKVVDYHFSDESNISIQLPVKQEKELSRKRSRKKKIVEKTDHELIEIKCKEIKIQQRADEDEKLRNFYTLKCEECGEYSLTFIELRAHYRQAHNIKRGYVKCCKRKMVHRGELQEHMIWHLNPDSFCCKVCGKTFSSTTALNLHLNYHSLEHEKIFCCDICGNRYSKKCLLSQHIYLKHAFNHHLKCDECNKTFKLKCHLNAHIENIHKNANIHICEICAKVFKSKYQFTLHCITEHPVNGERPVFQCTECGSCQTNQRTLRRHILKYHKFKGPIECKICGKIVPNRDALYSHTKYIHKLKPNFECHLCGKSFKTSLALKEHIASHTGAILYACPYCSKTFRSNSNMYRHRKVSHPIEWERDRKTKMPTLATM